MGDRPNVLLICTDQQFAGAMSCADNDDLRGRSVRDLAAGREVDNWREYVVTQTFQVLEGRMVRTDRHKYVVYDYGTIANSCSTSKPTPANWSEGPE